MIGQQTIIQDIQKQHPLQSLMLQPFSRAFCWQYHAHHHACKPKRYQLAKEPHYWARVDTRLVSGTLTLMTNRMFVCKRTAPANLIQKLPNTTRKNRFNKHPIICENSRCHETEQRSNNETMSQIRPIYHGAFIPKMIATIMNHIPIFV